MKCDGSVQKTQNSLMVLIALGCPVLSDGGEEGGDSRLTVQLLSLPFTINDGHTAFHLFHTS